MPKKASTKVLKTCRIEKQYIDYCTMQNINFNGLVNKLLEEFCYTHQRSCIFRMYYKEKGIDIDLSEHWET